MQSAGWCTVYRGLSTVYRTRPAAGEEDQTMDTQQNIITAGLQELGCGTDAVEYAGRLLDSGRQEELVRYLRRCRCSLMDDLHESQKRVDRMDYLIRQAEKNRK